MIMKDMKDFGLKPSKLVQEQQQFNKRMDRIACVLGCSLMLFCAIWWIDGILG